MTVVKYFDIANKAEHYGVLLCDKTLVCACCGGTFEAEEEGETYRILDSYDTNLEEVLEVVMEK